MSFSSDAKAELCRAKVDKKCCAIAESYGVLLYCNTFTPREIRIITASDAFAARLPRLFRRAFSVAFDVQPGEEAKGKRSFIIREKDKIERIFDSFGAEADATLSHHVNFGVIEEECDRVSFLRGAFLAGGSVTDPEKRYHLELATPHHAVSRESYSVLLELGFTARETQRGGNHLLYFKQADVIADFFTALGAPTTAMGVMTAKVEKEMRNTTPDQLRQRERRQGRLRRAGAARRDPPHREAGRSRRAVRAPARRGAAAHHEPRRKSQRPRAAVLSQGHEKLSEPPSAQDHGDRGDDHGIVFRV